MRLIDLPNEQPELKYRYRRVDWAVWKYEDIIDPSRPTHVYLRRLILVKAPFLAWYIHYLYAPDADRDNHNHPRPFISWVLRGGYIEDRFHLHSDGTPSRHRSRVRKRFSFARTRTTDFHTIFTLFEKPTITMLFLGGRSDEWGFMTPNGFVHNKVYIAEKEAQWRERTTA